MTLKTTLGILVAFVCISCNNTTKEPTTTPENAVIEETPTFTNKGHELVYAMMQEVGDYAALASKNDVVYTYTYQTPDGKKDVSTEKYIFDGEYSYGLYNTHQRTLPALEGPIEQGYDGKKYWLKNNGTIITDESALKRVAFNRPTNYYWFTMMQKLGDPGLVYEYVKEQTVNDINYDVVKVSFISTEDKPQDIYQLYINPETKRVDQFLFTVVDFGVIDPYLMEVSYEEVDGLKIPTKRRYKKSDWDATVTDAPWITVDWTDITFDNGLEKSLFVK